MVKPRENRVPIMMSDAELELVDDWRYKNRIATRSEAVRRLVQLGAVLDRSKNGLGVAIKGIGDQYMKILDKTHYLTAENPEPLTTDELELLSAIIGMTHNMAQLIPVVKKVTGLASNFTDTSDLEKTIEEAMQIEIIFDEGEARRKKLRND